MPNFKKRVYKQEGFSLIEVMVVVAIFFFIIAAIFDAYLSQEHASIVQQQVTDMQQNAQIGMDFLSKEIRMSGFGMPATAVNGFSNAVYPAINNNTNTGNGLLVGPDQITIVTGYRQISTLASAATQGAFSVSLTNNGNQFNTGTKQYLCIDAISQQDNYHVTTVSGNSLTLLSALTRNYAQGASVFLVKAITYSVNNALFLTRDDNTGSGAQTIAPNIEDLQFAYQLTGDPAWYNTTATPQNIRAVRINVLARTQREDQDWKKGHLGQRLAVEDHAAAGTKDGYRRRLLTSVVELRNLELQ